MSVLGFNLNISGHKHEDHAEEKRVRRAFDGMSIALRSTFHKDKLKNLDDNMRSVVTDVIQSKLSEVGQKDGDNKVITKKDVFEALNQQYFKTLYLEMNEKKNPACKVAMNKEQEIQAEKAFNAFKKQANIVASSSDIMLLIGKITSRLSSISPFDAIASSVNKNMRKIFGKNMGDKQVNRLNNNGSAVFDKRFEYTQGDLKEMALSEKPLTKEEKGEILENGSQKIIKKLFLNEAQSFSNEELQIYATDGRVEVRKSLIEHIPNLTKNMMLSLLNPVTLDGTEEEKKEGVKDIARLLLSRNDRTHPFEQPVIDRLLEFNNSLIGQALAQHKTPLGERNIQSLIDKSMNGDYGDKHDYGEGKDYSWMARDRILKTLAEGLQPLNLKQFERLFDDGLGVELASSMRILSPDQRHILLEKGSHEVQDIYRLAQLKRLEESEGTAIAENEDGSIDHADHIKTITKAFEVFEDIIEDFNRDEHHLVDDERDKKLNIIQEKFKNLFHIMKAYQDRIPKEGISDFCRIYEEELDGFNKAFQRLCNNSIFSMIPFYVEAGISKNALQSWATDLTYAIDPKA